MVKNLNEHKRLLASLFGIAVSAGILGYLVFGIKWQDFFGYLGQAKLRHLPFLFLLFAICMGIRAVRWRYLLPSTVCFSDRRLLESTLMGFFATMVLPLRAGEFVRPWMLSRYQSVSFPVAFASIVTERVFDVFALLVTLGICLSGIEQPPQLVVLGARALGLLALGILVLMVVCYSWSASVLRLVERMLAASIGRKSPAFAQRVLGLASGLIDGLRAISSFRELLLVLFWSLALWFEVGLFYEVGLWMFGLFPPYTAGLTVSAFVALAVAAPSAPGFIGTFQAGCAAALNGVFGYTEEFALAYSVVIHSFQAIILVAAGLVIMRVNTLKLRQLREQ